MAGPLGNRTPGWWIRRALVSSGAVALTLAGGLALVSVLLTEPLERSADAHPAAPSEPPSTGSSLVGVEAATATSGPAALAEEVTPLTPTRKPLSWPEKRVDGTPAKQFLLDYLLEVQSILAAVKTYTATFRKQERIEGVLGPEQTIALKLRHEPLSIYMRFLDHDAGKEVIYFPERFDNFLIGHKGGLARRLLPRLKLAPDSPLALAENRRPVNEAGLARMVDRLVEYRRLDLKDADAVTILDRVTNDEGLLRYQALHLHEIQTDERPFARVEVLFDPVTLLPVQFTGYDWPDRALGQSEPQLGERYSYSDVQFDAPLEDLDFDPANTLYEFRRF